MEDRNWAHLTGGTMLRRVCRVLLFLCLWTARIVVAVYMLFCVAVFILGAVVFWYTGDWFISALLGATALVVVGMFRICLE